MVRKSTVAIIIPTLNEADYIAGLLDSITIQTLSPTKVLVVDGGSQDRTTKIVLRYSNVELLRSKKGISKQRNTGAFQIAKHCDWLLFLDADARLPSAETLHTLLSLADHKQLDCACPRYLPWPGNILLNSIFTLFNFSFWLGQHHFPTGIGSVILVKSSLFAKLKGFDEHKAVLEDIDLIQRASQQGLFGIIPVDVWVSDRRFRKYGILNTLKQYLHMSWLLIRNRPHHFPSHTYIFGDHQRPRD